ncbi:MAG TPA: acyl-CoA reductase [Flavisolibacter sp.]|jgi:hypothetical protein|nr:acyl-CoA reductase [Flavisolibacter sp.]
MNLQERKEVLLWLGRYMLSKNEEWDQAKRKAQADNAWFTEPFIGQAIQNITTQFLTEKALDNAIAEYDLSNHIPKPKKVGIVMAGNIPLVGMHDLISVFLTGHYAHIKPSSKDFHLVNHLVNKLLQEWPQALPYFTIRERLTEVDAYIATGSNNTSRYFEYYFRNYPSIIRKNRTSVAILSGSETKEQLEALADDIQSYFGLGCRNITKLYVPAGYDFLPLLNALRKYDHLKDHNKYRNNMDYNLAIHILNNTYYMTNDSIVLVEDASFFSPISQLHYEFYTDGTELRNNLRHNETIQCIVSLEDVPFGQAQCPSLFDYADGVDTIQFLLSLS